MSEKNTDWLCGGVFHLQGGVRAINMQGPAVSLSPDTVHGKMKKVPEGLKNNRLCWRGGDAPNDLIFNGNNEPVQFQFPRN